MMQEKPEDSGHKYPGQRTVFPGHWGLLRRGHGLELTRTPRRERLEVIGSVGFICSGT